MMCYVCNDIKKAESRKINAKRVLYAVEKLLPTGEIKKIEAIRGNKKEASIIARSLSSSKSNVHLMCGRCVKFNSNELKTIENNINKKLVYAILYMTSTSKEDPRKAEKFKYNLCSVLRGNYPVAHRIIEKNYLKECLKEKRNEIV